MEIRQWVALDGVMIEVQRSGCLGKTVECCFAKLMNTMRLCCSYIVDTSN
jgi:hypothetical protein